MSLLAGGRGQLGLVWGPHERVLPEITTDPKMIQEKKQGTAPTTNSNASACVFFFRVRLKRQWKK